MAIRGHGLRRHCRLLEDVEQQLQPRRSHSDTFGGMNLSRRSICGIRGHDLRDTAVRWPPSPRREPRTPPAPVWPRMPSRQWLSAAHPAPARSSRVPRLMRMERLSADSVSKIWSKRPHGDLFVTLSTPSSHMVTFWGLWTGHLRNTAC